MEGLILLCDYAEEINGKLYIMGGGWSRILANTAAPGAVAIRLLIPWNDANKKLHIQAQVLTDDGEPVTNNEGQAIGFEGEIEVGRPPGMRPGSYLDAPLVVRLPMMFEPGAYSWVLKVNGDEIARSSFEAREGGV